MAAISFDYDLQVAQLTGKERTAAKIGAFNAKIEAGDHFRITKLVLMVAAAIFVCFAKVFWRCSQADIDKHTICYFNDCIMRQAVGIKKWDEVPTYKNLQDGKPAIYLKSFKLTNAKGENREIPSVCFYARVEDNCGKGTYGALCFYNLLHASWGCSLQLSNDCKLEKDTSPTQKSVLKAVEPRPEKSMMSQACNMNMLDNFGRVSSVFYNLFRDLRQGNAAVVGPEGLQYTLCAK